MCFEDEKGGSGGEGRKVGRGVGRHGLYMDRKELSSTNINGMVRKRGSQMTGGHLINKV